MVATRTGQKRGHNGSPREPEKEDVEMQNEDSSSNDDATAAAGSRSVGKKVRAHCSYLLLRATVKESKKGTATMKAKLQEVFSLLLEADETAILSFFQTDPTTNSNGFFTVNVKKVLTSPQSFPDSITGLSKYFFGCRPNSKGGTIFSQIRLMHSSPIENLLTDVREDLREMECGLSMQAIQHWNVHTLGWLKNLHPEVDGVALQDYLNSALRDTYKDDVHKIGIKLKTPYDGKKSDYSKDTKFKDRLQAYHVDTIASVHAEVAASLKALLAHADFKQRYTCSVRLVPCFDRKSSPYTQDKVRKCILQHSQWCQCVTSMSVEGFASLDLPNKNLDNKSLRQCILELEDSHFINIDLNWSKTHYSVIFPKKYESVAKDKIAHIGAYLHKQFGDHILTSFTPELQQVVADTSWDDDTGRPISKVDRELDTIIDMDDDLDYVDTSFLTSQNTSAPPLAPSSEATKVFIPRSSPVPMQFVPLEDDDSVSTFGTTAYKSPPKDNPPSLRGSFDSSTVVSSITMESRVSQVESTLGDLKSMLQTLVTASTRAASPSLGKAGKKG